LAVIDVPQPQPEKIISYADLVKRVREEADLDESEMEQLRRVGAVASWQVEGQCPAMPTHVIFAMFVGENGDRTDSDHMAGDVRVYARPKVLVDQQGELAPFFRFIINRAPNTALRSDAMPVDAWISDVAYELNASVIEEDEEDDEPAPICKSCKTELEDDAKFCHRCAAPVMKCGNCGHLGDLPDKFCAGCGVPLVQPSAPAVP
jgi:hypothetical protein